MREELEIAGERSAREQADRSKDTAASGSQLENVCGKKLEPY